MMSYEKKLKEARKDFDNAPSFLKGMQLLYSRLQAGDKAACEVYDQIGDEVLRKAKSSGIPV